MPHLPSLACTCAVAVWLAAATPTAVLAASAAPFDSSRADDPAVVCLALSPAVTTSAVRMDTTVAEANTIWAPLGVHVTRRGPDERSCDFAVVVKADTEALPEDETWEGAIGWVPFVAGRPRRVVFLRMARVEKLLRAVSPEPGFAGLRALWSARFLGRVLAHELGHILLATRSHTARGLMRQVYQPGDVLKVRASAYTLAPAERAQLFARLSGERHAAK
jgi:hypothetical protein